MPEVSLWVVFAEGWPRINRGLARNYQGLPRLRSYVSGHKTGLAGTQRCSGQARTAQSRRRNQLHSGRPPPPRSLFG